MLSYFENEFNFSFTSSKLIDDTHYLTSTMNSLGIREKPQASIHNHTKTIVEDLKELKISSANEISDIDKETEPYMTQI